MLMKKVLILGLVLMSQISFADKYDVTQTLGDGQDFTSEACPVIPRNLGSAARNPDETTVTQNNIVQEKVLQEGTGKAP